MKTGDLILIPFPFADLPIKKLRPAVIIGVTKDKHKDFILPAISSVVPTKISENELIINPGKLNRLKVISVIKVDRIVTIKHEDKFADILRIPL